MNENLKNLLLDEIKQTQIDFEDVLTKDENYMLEVFTTILKISDIGLKNKSTLFFLLKELTGFDTKKCTRTLHSISGLCPLLRYLHKFVKIE
jgi:hypothetical protein